MKEYIELPLLTEINCPVRAKKFVSGKGQLTLDKAYVAPKINNQLLDQATCQGIHIENIWKENNSYNYLLSHKVNTDTVEIRIDRENRIKKMNYYMTIKLIEILSKKLFSTNLTGFKFKDAGCSLGIELLDSSIDVNMMLKNLADAVNSIINSGLDVEIKKSNEDYYMLVASVGQANIEYPVPLNTKEPITLVILSYKQKDLNLEVEFMVGDDAIEFYKNQLKASKKIKKILNEDKDLVQKIEYMIKEKSDLEKEMSNLKNYVYNHYKALLDLPSYYVDETSVSSLVVEDMNIKNLEDFAKTLDEDVICLSRNNGEFAHFYIETKIADLDIKKVIDSVNTIYRLDFTGENPIKGKILTEYQKRFQDTFDKYLREYLSKKHIEETEGVQMQMTSSEEIQ